MLVEADEKILSRVFREVGGLSRDGNKLIIKEPTSYCKFCEFSSNDGWEQNAHFKKTGHNQFLPINLIHERVGEAKLLRPWDVSSKTEKTRK